MDNHVRRDNLFDGIFDGFAGSVDLFEAGSARHADGDIHEIALAGFADANAFALQHAFGFVHGGFDAFAKAVGSNVEQCFGSAFPQARADPDNHASHREGRDSVELAEPRNAVTEAEPCARNSQNYDERAPDIGGEMERIGFESLAGIFAGNAIQAARAKEINSHAAQQNDDGGEAGTNALSVKEKTLKGFENNVKRGEEKQRGFDKRRKTFNLAVAIEVIGVGWLVGDSDREESDDRSKEIETGMHGLGQNAQAASANNEKNFQRHQDDRRTDGSEGRYALFARCQFG